MIVTDLVQINNLKVVFRNIRDYLAGNMTGITRDEQIAQNLMLILFCKLYDEKYNDNLEFYVTKEDSDNALKDRIHSILLATKNKYQNIFSDDDEIQISGASLRYIVTQLSPYKLMDAARDIMADAFEELISTSIRGGEGQFFTPRNVVEMLIAVLNPHIGEKVMEPACGSGGFLAYILRNYQSRAADDYCLHGIEKDSFLAKLSKMYLAILGDPLYNVFCENSLETPKTWNTRTNKVVKLENYDVILTNPPFGAKIPIVEPSILEQYELGHRWKKIAGEWKLTKSLRDKQPPQILFLERIIQFLKPGGRAGIVLPDGMFGNPSDRYIWEYVRKYAKIFGVVSLSQEAFQPSTHTKTSVLFVEKKQDIFDNSVYNIFMAVAKAIGHNKNGKPVYKIDKNGEYLFATNGEKLIDDDIPQITENFLKFLAGEEINNSSLGFVVSSNDIVDNVYIPESYNLKVGEMIESLQDNSQYKLIPFGDFVTKGIINVQRGNEIGSQFYGTGDIPFVRTSDIVNWEIKADPVKSVSEEVYEKYRWKQNIQENDILFVNDGTFLIGRSAIITPVDTKIVIQSHLRHIHLNDFTEFDAHYLFYLLNTEFVQSQIKKKIFTQATLSTLGNRLNDILLPFHVSPEERRKISTKMKCIMQKKAETKQLMQDIFTEYNV